MAKEKTTAKLNSRPRRLRQTAAIRALVKETTLRPEQLIYPIFVCEGKNEESRHKLVPGIVTVSIDKLKPLLKRVQELGVKTVDLFGVVKNRDAKGSGAFDKKGPVVCAIKEIREHFPDLLIATDIALDPYTDHGHDGLYQGGKILNDETVKVLCEMSLLHAEAGAHMVSPSDMMDGRIGAIRSSLEIAGFEDTIILAYTAKYASCLYGPFRDTLNVSLKGDKKSYQMDPANRREAIRELRLDLDEGADIVMVKPALWYLDVISDFKARTDLPIAAYHVSGEAAMIEVGAAQGLFERDRAIMEALHSIRRAGADLILTYHALDAARLLN